jgi:hypothetical protein
VAVTYGGTVGGGAVVPEHDTQTNSYFTSAGIEHGTADRPERTIESTRTVGGFRQNTDGTLSAIAAPAATTVSSGSGNDVAGASGVTGADVARGITPTSGLNNPQVVSQLTRTGSTTSTNTPVNTDPFSQLTNLLSGLASQGAGTTALPSTDTAATTADTTGGPSIVLPLILLLLAGGAGYYYWRQQRHKGAHAGASHAAT